MALNRPPLLALKNALPSINTAWTPKPFDGVFGRLEFPDWRNSRAYPEHEHMPSIGYRWELMRRSSVYKDAHHKWRTRYIYRAYAGERPVTVAKGDPQWTANFEALNTMPALYKLYELNVPIAAAGLPQVIDPHDEFALVIARRALAAGQVLLVADPDANLESTLELGRKWHQRKAHEQPASSDLRSSVRQRQEKYTTYLRVLDARSGGVSISAISKQLKSENKNIASSQDGVRDSLRAAKEWQQRFVAKFVDSSANTGK